MTASTPLPAAKGLLGTIRSAGAEALAAIKRIGLFMCKSRTLALFLPPTRKEV
eukprot:CAMPEP_0115836878 /NCGR_PEP_ID=MMETSP0287-20121206/4934_1 /TAXON_ID=412157 /ORGANISM="Chrysochromulina rotalis, Strain UIO044" /LENGTH=52 /DNA_ID=CAMNT_0003290375 /DNA_START=57 /DNA_END=215 /DNA_ORIENTATION=-